MTYYNIDNKVIKYAKLMTAPTEPQSLEVTAGDGYVTISWQSPGSDGGYPITEYKIYCGTSPEDMVYLDSVAESTTRYNDTSVTNGETYYYYVAAVNSIGESDPSEETFATPMESATQPSPPHSVHVKAGDGYNKLSWQPPDDDGNSDIIKYKIYRGMSQGGEIFITSVTGSDLIYNDTSVTNGETHYYYVTAVNSIGESEPSDEISGTPKEPDKNDNNHNDGGFIPGFEWIYLLAAFIGITTIGILKRRLEK